MQRPKSGSTSSAPQEPPAQKLELPKGMTMASLNKRPSIAPVPAVLEANGIEITVESDSNSDAFTADDDEEETWSTPAAE